MKYQEINNHDLKDFLKYSEVLTNLYEVPRNDYNSKWINVKTSIANSITSLYKFSNSLFKDEKFNSKKENIRFYLFYFDLIISKLRYSIFTETPKKSFIDIHTYTAKNIASIGEKILAYENTDDDFEIDFQRFIFKIFLMYDFIFYKDSGVFTRFELNSELYTEINSKCFIFNDEQIRDYGKDVIYKILKTTMSFYNKSGMNESNVYQNFVDSNKKQILLIEPLSYYLGFKIWKFAKILQSTYEFSSMKDYQIEKDEFKKAFIEYLNNSNEIIGKFYNGEITNRELFLNLGKLDNIIMKNHLFATILPNYSSKEFQLDRFF